MTDPAETLWVIVRSSGEYSDRIETPIRYCLTEAAAKQAVELVKIEAQRDADKKPYWNYASAYGWQNTDGTWADDFRVEGTKWRPLPDFEAIQRQNDIWQQEHKSACLALGHVDPDGSWSGDEYYYAPVTLWQPTVHAVLQEKV
jgi:hypothetical protein